MPSIFQKDPNATLDYQWNYAEWLDTDTIASHQIIVPIGLTLVSSTHTSSAVTAWISGGTVGKTYAVVCRITTTAGRIDDRTISLEIRER